MARRSDAFRAFHAAQIEVNDFLWSSELSYTLVQRLVLTPQVKQDVRQVHEIFKDVRPKPHALIPPRSRAGAAPRKAKYQADVCKLDADLKANLEALSRYVIVRFHSALEHFILARCEPHLPWAAFPRAQKKQHTKRFQELAYQDLQRYFERHMPTSRGAAIPRTEAVIAQSHRMLRNSFIHPSTWDASGPWSDFTFRAKIAAHREFSAADRDSILNTVCDAVDSKVALRPEVPRLFWYALFCLTNYRKLALAVENRMPPP